MVKIEYVPVKILHEKLKKKRIEQLAKDVFGNGFDINEFIGDINVARKAKFLEKISFNIPRSFLSVCPIDNSFILYNKEYFDKTKELAEKYESNFGREVTIKTRYISKY